MLNRREFLSRFRLFFAQTSVLRRRVIGVLRIYDQLESHIRRLKGKTGLRCAEGCGRCCENPRVEASVLDVMPLAAALWLEGRGDQTLRDMDQAPGRRCVFYKADPLVPGRGLCSVYAYRPLLCRLYGFAANRHKKSQPIFVGCPMIRELHPESYEKVEQMIEEKSEDVPVMSDYGTRVSGVDPELGRVGFPINEAVKEALIKIGLQMKLKNDP